MGEGSGGGVPGARWRAAWEGVPRALREEVASFVRDDGAEARAGAGRLASVDPGEAARLLGWADACEAAAGVLGEACLEEDEATDPHREAPGGLRATDPQREEDRARRIVEDLRSVGEEIASGAAPLPTFVMGRVLSREVVACILGPEGDGMPCLPLRTIEAIAVSHEILRSAAAGADEALGHLRAWTPAVQAGDLAAADEHVRLAEAALRGGGGA